MSSAREPEQEDPRLLWAAEEALAAPSIENSQPWRWVVRPGSLELHADRDRQLVAVDPTGRSLVVSCGVALHHATVSLRARALVPTVTMFPEGPGSDLLARVVTRPGGRGADEVSELLALRSRRTDRRRFTAWPVPRARVARLLLRAHDHGASAVDLTTPESRRGVAELVEEARRTRRSEGDRGPVWEQGRRPTDGPVRLSPTDTVVVLGGADDLPRTWLVTGTALSALWLRGEREGLAVVPVSEVVEIETTRLELRRRVLDDAFEPHLVLRVGWRPLGRPPGSPPPRRAPAGAIRVVGPGDR